MKNNRKQQIHALLVLGFTAPEISERLYLGLSGVKYHINQIYFINGVNNQTQLAAKHYLGDAEFTKRINQPDVPKLVAA